MGIWVLIICSYFLKFCSKNLKNLENFHISMLMYYLEGKKKSWKRRVVAKQLLWWGVRADARQPRTARLALSGLWWHPPSLLAPRALSQEGALSVAMPFWTCGLPWTKVGWAHVTTWGYHCYGTMDEFTAWPSHNQSTFKSKELRRVRRKGRKLLDQEPTAV